MKKTCKACKSEIDAKASKCPKCGTDQRNWFARHPILTILGLLLIIPSAISGFIKGTSPYNTNTPTPMVITEEYKTSLANSFCKNRSNGKPYYDLQWIADSINGKDIGDHPNYVTKQPLSENCKIVTEFCLKQWSKEDCENIANKNIWIGMTSLQLVYSWGMPKNINDTTTAFGIHSQWVYGTFKPYVYLEGKDKNNLKVTSWQD